jgi:threonine dehydratase
MAGQGSCGVEIARQLPAADVVLVAVGGGGLISGVGSVLRAHNPAIGIIACQPAASAVMAHSVAAGRILEMPSNKTLSDGTAGGIEEGAITFELCRELSDEFVLVDEAEIAAAMRLYMDSEHQLIEGAAGVAVAGLLAKKADLRGKKVVVLICGANISRGSLRAVVC